MKYIKLYESKHSVPWINDYVIIDNYNNNDNLSEILSKMIGRITNVERLSGIDKYYVTYEFQDFIKVGQDKTWKCIVDRDKIYHFSNKKKKMELILQQNKYNL